MAVHCSLFNTKLFFMPGQSDKPIDDLARALNFILRNSDTFQLEHERYAVAGFSSGGHLAAEWGTGNKGYSQYCLPGPEAIFLGYPASDLKIFQETSSGKGLLHTMLGEQYTEETLLEYNVNDHITQDYPPVYLWHCKDDPVVPFRAAVRMKERLEQQKCPCILREVNKGGHGFGLGEFSEAAGWLEEAVEFWIGV